MLFRSVEVVFPIEQADLKARLIDEIISLSEADTVKARQLQADGSYERVMPAAGEAPLRSQQRFLDLAAESERRQAAPQPEPPSATAAPKIVRRARAKRGG